MKPTLLLFDIDGTLLYTHGAGGRAMRRAAAHLFGDAFSFDGVPFGGRLDPAIFADAARRNAIGNPEAHLERFRAAYLRELPKALKDGEKPTEALPGVLELLTTLRERLEANDALTLGLLSGNYRHAAPLKLGAAAIDPDWFNLTAFADDADTRPGLVAHALERYESSHDTPIDRQRVIVIGDTPHDVDCARAHGCTAFAVTTGACRRTELEACNPDVLVDDLTDPAPVLDLLE